MRPRTGAGVAIEIAITIGDPPTSTPSPLPSVEPGIVPDVVGVGEGDAFKVLSQAGFEATSTYEPTPGVAAGIVVSTEPAPGIQLDAGSTVRLVVSGTSVALDGYLTELACSEPDMMPFGHTGPYVLPAGEAFVRGNVVGIRTTDELGQIGIPGDWQGVPTWEVTRDGAATAVIDGTTLEGIACRGSGIGGV